MLGSTFYIDNTASSASSPPMTYNVINFPSIKDISRSYIITTLIKTNATYAANAYASSITYNSNGQSPNFTIRFSTSPTTVLASASQTNVGSIISQTICYIYQTNDSSFAFSNLSLYNNN